LDDASFGSDDLVENCRKILNVLDDPAACWGTHPAFRRNSSWTTHPSAAMILSRTAGRYSMSWMILLLVGEPIQLFAMPCWTSAALALPLAVLVSFPFGFPDLCDFLAARDESGPLLCGSSWKSSLHQVVLGMLGRRSTAGLSAGHGERVANAALLCPGRLRCLSPQLLLQHGLRLDWADVLSLSLACEDHFDSRVSSGGPAERGNSRARAPNGGKEGVRFLEFSSAQFIPEYESTL